MEIITIISIFLPYFIFIIWAYNLKNDNKKLRSDMNNHIAELEKNQKKEIDSLIDNIKNIVDVSNQNNKGQDKNWKMTQDKFEEIDSLSKIQDKINQDNNGYFQEFDSIIELLDKKVNKVLDDQEKYSIKRDIYENRLTEVCKVLDILNVRMNEQSEAVNVIIDNATLLSNDLLKTNHKINELNQKVESNDNVFKAVLSSVDNKFKIIKEEFKKPDVEIDTNSLAKDVELLEKKVSEIDRTLNKVIQRQLTDKPSSCEIKLKMKEQIKSEAVNKIEWGTQIVNKVEFEWMDYTFKKGCIFLLKNGILESKYKTSTKSFREGFAQSLWQKVLELNKPKQKRKYTKKNEKAEAIKKD